MRRMLMLLLSASLLLLGGCSQVPAPGQGASAPPPRLPSLHLLRSGGIAGVDDKLQIDSDGEWTLTGRTVATSGQLDTAARVRLAQILNDPALGRQISAMPSVACCDQFTYVLRVDSAEYTFVNQGSPGPLVAQLLDLLHRQTGF